MKQNTYTLTGQALDWAVAKCEGFTDYDHNTETMMPPRKEYGRVNFDEYSYSTDWGRGGAIIEREQMCVQPSMQEDVWFASSGDDNFAYGKTPLIAAMRCYVANKLGSEVDIPEELLKGETVCNQN